MLHLLLQFGRADDVQMRNPVLHDGNDFHGMDVFAREQKTAIFQFAHGFLIGQQGAALEVGSSFGADVDDDFTDLVAVANAVGFADLRLQFGIDDEGFRLDCQLLHLREAVGFLLVSVQPDEIPDAVFVDEMVRSQAVVLAFCAAVFAIRKFDVAVFADGTGKEIEFCLLATNILILKAFDADALVQLFLIEATIYFGKEFLDAGKAGDTADFFLIEVALAVFVEAVDARTLFGVIEIAEALVHVALDGAHGGLEAFCELVDVEPLTLVQLHEDVGKAMCEPFVFFLGHGCFRWLIGFCSLAPRFDRLCRRSSLLKMRRRIFPKIFTLVHDFITMH